MPNVTRATYDGYDRVVSEKDPMGNEVLVVRDANANPTVLRFEGELVDGPGSAGNVRLAEITRVYDALDRLVRTDRAHFDPATQAPLGDGVGRTSAVWSDASRIVSVTDDHGHVSTATYDTATRLATVTDALGNEVAYAYDADSNVTAVTSTEKSDLGNPDQVFSTSYTYDAMDRIVLSVDNVGNQTEQGFDSRGLLTRTVDALGNETRHGYDGLARRVWTARDLDMDGADPADPDDLVLSCQRDDGSRTIVRTDARGNDTTLQYDARGLLASVLLADGTSHAFTHDRLGRCVGHVDPSGSVVTNTYDALSRLTGKTVTPGAGVASTTTMEGFGFDGLGRVRSAANDAATVLFLYDSLGSLVRETRGGKSTVAACDAMGNPSQVTYPGGRTVVRTFDALERVTSVLDTAPTTLASAIRYVGPRRIERVELGNGTRSDFVHDGITGVPNAAGDFGVGRTIASTHRVELGGALVDQRAYGWDPTQRKILRDDLLAGGPQLEHLYAYDPIHRLTSSLETPAMGPGVATTYTLDATGNRMSVTGGPDPGVYTMDATLPAPADAQVDQYTTTPFDARVYDARGNLAAIDVGMASQRLFKWDYRRRLVEVQDAATGQRHTYAYDALGRRIQKVVDADGTPVTTRYYYRGARVVEERNGADAVIATYARSLDGRPAALAGRLVLDRGGGADELELGMRRGASDFTYHADDVGSIVAITDVAGVVLERYDYGDFGAVAVLDGAHDPLAGTAVGNPYGFRGMRLDAETGWLASDGSARVLDPRSGRWLDASLAASGELGAAGVMMDGEYQLVPPRPAGSAAGIVEIPPRNLGVTELSADRTIVSEARGESRTAYASGDPWSTAEIGSSGEDGVRAPGLILPVGLGIGSSGEDGARVPRLEPPVWLAIGSSGQDGVRSPGLILPVGLGIGSSGEDGFWVPRVEPTDWDDHLYTGPLPGSGLRHDPGSGPRPPWWPWGPGSFHVERSAGRAHDPGGDPRPPWWSPYRLQPLPSRVSEFYRLRPGRVFRPERLGWMSVRLWARWFGLRRESWWSEIFDDVLDDISF